jgi:predicted HicB family RNase H-like nuclease
MELEYKGYTGTANWLEVEQIYYGRLNILEDVITFKGTPVTVKQYFKDAVGDYLEFCLEQGKEPDKPLEVLEQGLKNTKGSTLILPKYKGYEAIVEWSDYDNVFFGQATPYKGLLSFEGNTLKEVIVAFKEAIEEELSFTLRK